MSISLALLLLVACRNSGGERGLSVVASFYPLAEVVTKVGGGDVRVTNLTPAGVEPHDLELTPKQVDQLQDAPLVVYVGSSFQVAVSEIVKRRTKPSLDVLSQLRVDAADPHFWLDPTLLANVVDEVRDALVAATPTRAATFRANTQQYKDELSKLDRDMGASLGWCARREIVTTHEAFHYLAARYGLTQLAIAGVTPDAEPDPARLATLADEIRAKHITTVFFEELVSPKVAQSLAREAGVKTAVLNPIESDTGHGYIAAMRANLGALRTALDCE